MDLIAEEAVRADQLKGRRLRLLCEIPFEKDDIDKLQQSLLPQGIEAWNRTPTLAAMMTVGLGVYYYDRGDFWKPFTSSNSLYGDDAFTFMLSGLPSPQELTEAMRAMRSGSLTVEKAHSTYLFPKYAKRRSDSPGGE